VILKHSWLGHCYPRDVKAWDLTGQGETQRAPRKVTMQRQYRPTVAYHAALKKRDIFNNIRDIHMLRE
jgi:hypothetical protein